MYPPLCRERSSQLSSERKRELNWIGLVFPPKILFINYQRHNLTMFLKLRDFGSSIYTETNSRHKMTNYLVLFYFLHKRKSSRSPERVSVCRAWGASPERVELRFGELMFVVRVSASSGMEFARVEQNESANLIRGARRDSLGAVKLTHKVSPSH